MNLGVRWQAQRDTALDRCIAPIEVRDQKRFGTLATAFAEGNRYE